MDIADDLLMSYKWYEIHFEVAPVYNSPVFYSELDFSSPLVALPGKGYKQCTGSSRLLRISLLRFFKTITKIWLMRFYGLFILLLRT